MQVRLQVVGQVLISKMMGSGSMSHDQKCTKTAVLPWISLPCSEFGFFRLCHRITGVVIVMAVDTLNAL